MPANHNEIEKRLWEAADELRANSKLKSAEYAIPVLGLIFLRYASEKFADTERQLREKQEAGVARLGLRTIKLEARSICRKRAGLKIYSTFRRAQI